MSKKVLLIRPKNVYNYNNYPSLGLICIGSQLASCGYEVKIINCALEDEPLQAVLREAGGALFAGISLLTAEIPHAYEVMRCLKERYAIPLVSGGWHSTLFPEQMARCQYVDFVACGDGEENIISIAQAVSGNEPAGKIFQKKFIDLDSLPLPDYSLDQDIETFITGDLTDKFAQYSRAPLRWLPYETSRGCPCECSFCVNVVADNRLYRSKSADKVISEISEISGRYRLTHLKIIDDNFFADIKRSRRICEGMISKGLGVTWDAECRCDYFRPGMLDEETLRLFKRSGLVQLTLGVESGSRRTLEIMKKGITLEQAESAVRKCDEHGIIARCSIMIEVPGEDSGDILKTLKFVNKLKKYPRFTCGMTTFRPYPKCGLTEELIRKTLLSQPTYFQEWSRRENIEMYTALEFRRPWQVNPGLSEKICYYFNMEFSARLGDHQIAGGAGRMLNRLFVLLARLRNRFMFYGFPLEVFFYKKFLSGFYSSEASRRNNENYRRRVRFNRHPPS